MPVTKTCLADIQRLPNRRPLDERKVEELMASIKEVGLLHLPRIRVIHSMMIDGELIHRVPVVVTGAHRIEALIRLGHDWHDVEEVELDDIDAERMEIAENLHRNDLTALQRAEALARWIELTDIKLKAQEVLSAHADKTSKGGRPKGGVRAAARELKVNKDVANDAAKIAGMTSEAKAKAEELGLDNSRNALRKAAKEAEPAKQVEVLQQIHDERKAPKPPRERKPKQAPAPTLDLTPAAVSVDDDLPPPRPRRTLEEMKLDYLALSDRDKVAFADWLTDIIPSERAA